MTVKKYPARIYRGRARKQTLRHPVTGFLIGCTDTCLAMAIDDATCGTVNVSELDVRMLTDEWPVKPSNKSPGLNQDQLVMASKKLHFRYAKCNGQGWAALAAAIVGVVPARLVARLDPQRLLGQRLGRRRHGGHRWSRRSCVGRRPGVGRHASRRS